MPRKAVFGAAVGESWSTINFEGGYEKGEAGFCFDVSVDLEIDAFLQEFVIVIRLRT
jgi:hypothetical protein